METLTEGLTVEVALNIANAHAARINGETGIAFDFDEIDRVLAEPETDAE